MCHFCMDAMLEDSNKMRNKSKNPRPKRKRGGKQDVVAHLLERSVVSPDGLNKSMGTRSGKRKTCKSPVEYVSITKPFSTPHHVFERRYIQYWLSSPKKARMTG